MLGSLLSGLWLLLIAFGLESTVLLATWQLLVSISVIVVGVEFGLAAWRQRQSGGGRVRARVGWAVLCAIAALTFVTVGIRGGIEVVGLIVNPG